MEGEKYYSRGILHNFVAKHTRVFNTLEHKTTTRLLAVEFQSSLSSALAGIKHIIAQITKAHHLCVLLSRDGATECNNDEWYLLEPKTWSCCAGKGQEIYSISRPILANDQTIQTFVNPSNRSISRPCVSDSLFFVFHLHSSSSFDKCPKFSNTQTIPGCWSHLTAPSLPQTKAFLLVRMRCTTRYRMCWSNTFSVCTLIDFYCAYRMFYKDIKKMFIIIIVKNQTQIQFCGIMIPQHHSWKKLYSMKKKRD